MEKELGIRPKQFEVSQLVLKSHEKKEGDTIQVNKEVFHAVQEELMSQSQSESYVDVSSYKAMLSQIKRLVEEQKRLSQQENVMLLKENNSLTQEVRRLN